ncbi:DUF2721 domain-containing protein [Acetobacter sp. AN02]|uniref:DUF2721 domain-containing protein n=1 Tax=Acetobacter sp. AN02 TaxID=2894186 RepID=UPI0024345A91|nr:DUF2721 domain-containing protein [Acetobacter sp. AN02]MDG6093879.1 DUF2721 domain-containing protein [Acetobacter sp. AN02]
MALPVVVPGADSAGDVAHLIGVALTPVFMLSGVGTLLNLFNTRLSRVADHIEKVSDLLDSETDHDARHLLKLHLAHLSRRMSVLDTAIVFGGTAGAMTCGAAFVLFLGSVRDAKIVWWLVVLFGLALISTTLALASFLVDSVLAWHSLKKEGPVPKSLKRSAMTE